MYKSGILKNLFLAKKFGNMNIHFESMLNKVGKDIARFERKQRITAANHIRSVIKSKAAAMRRTGNLERGVYSKHNEDVSFVGIHSPAYHAYLIEFGHEQRKTRNGPSIGHVPAYPIVYPTFSEEADTAISIMSHVVSI